MPPYLTKVLLDRVITPRNTPLLPAVVLPWSRSTWLSAGLDFPFVCDAVGRPEGAAGHAHRAVRGLQMLRLRFYTQRETGGSCRASPAILPPAVLRGGGRAGESSSTAATMVLIAGILLFMNWRLFLFALAPMPLIGISTAVFGHRIHGLYHRICAAPRA